MGRRAFLFGGILLVCAAYAAAERIALDTLRIVATPLWNAPSAIEIPAGGKTTWCGPALDGNVIVRFRVTPRLRQPARLRFHFMASADRTRPEAYRLRLDFASDASVRATFSKDPGDWLIAQNNALIPGVGTPVDVAVAKSGAHVWAYVNDTPVLIWRDVSVTEEPQDLVGGAIGFDAEEGNFLIESLRAARIESHALEPLTKLCDPCLETDLRRASIVVGESLLHRDLSQDMVSAMARVIGYAPQVKQDVEVLGSLPFSAAEPVVVLGNMSDNLVIRRLYLEMFSFVDRAFPGPGGYLIQTIHNPWGTGQNVIVVGASDDAGLRSAVRRFNEYVAAGPVIGRIYDIRPAERFEHLRETDDRAETINRVTLPLLWPQAFQLVYNDAVPPTILYLATGEDRYAERARREILHQVDEGLCKHLYFLPRPIVWYQIESHPCFSDAERLKITNWLLDQLRSTEGIQMYSLVTSHRKELLSNHGTRTAIGCFFAARYFRDRYHLKEANVYLELLRRYFEPQETISQPACDSSAHQWGGTSEDQAIYALASGNLGFFQSGAARRAADRALAITSPLGHIADVNIGFGANSFLAKAAHFYRDGRYKWAHTLRTDGTYGSDEFMRTFADDLPVVPPTDLVGVTVVPWDRGTWDGYAGLAPRLNYTLPNIPFEKAFNKIAFRTDLTPSAEFLLLDGMNGASHDPDTVHVVHEYSRGGRIYLTHHNTLDILRDGLSGTLPSCAELLHAGAFGPVMLSQTRLNDWGDADWTRTVFLLPAGFLAFIERVTARQTGDFTVTAHWHTLGKPTLRKETLTVLQFPKQSEGDEREKGTTAFHIQAPGDRVWLQGVKDAVLQKMYRGYAYSSATLQQFNQLRARHLNKDDTMFLYALMHLSAGPTQPAIRMSLLAPGVVRVTREKGAAYVGAPVGPVTIGCISLDADAFYLDADHLVVAGGRKAVIDGKTVLESAEPVSREIPLKSAPLAAQLGSSALDRPFDVEPPPPPPPAMSLAWQVEVGGEVRYLRSDLPSGSGILAVPVGWGPKGKAGDGSGKLLFLDPVGKVIRTLAAEARVNDAAVADVDGDGEHEILLELEDRSLQCLSQDGRERFRFRPEQEEVISPSNTWLQKNSAQRVWVVDAAGCPGKTIVVSTGDQRIHGLDARGKRIWMASSRPGIATVLEICDVNGDGRKELLVGNRDISNSGILWVLGGRDQPLETFSPRTGPTLNAVLVADLDGDGREELFVATQALACLDPRTMDVRWSQSFGDEVRGIAVVPRDSMVVAASRNEYVVAFDPTGHRRWACYAGTPIEFLATLHRGEGDVLLAAVGETGLVSVLDTTGRILYQYDLKAAPTAVTVPQAAPSLLCVATTDGRVTALTTPR